MITSSSTRSIGCWRSRVSASGPFATTCTRWPARASRRLSISRLAALSSTTRMFPVSVFGAGATAIRAVSESAIGASGGALTPSAIMVCKVCAAVAIRSRSWPTSAAAVCWACALSSSAAAMMELMGPEASALRRRRSISLSLRVRPLRHHQVQYDHVGTRFGQMLQREAAVARPLDLPSLLLEHAPHALAHDLIVVHQQDLACDRTADVLQQAYEPLAVDRLGHVFRGAEGVAAAAVVLDRHQHHRDVCQLRIALERRQHRPAIQVRHIDVERDRRGVKFARQLQA